MARVARPNEAPEAALARVLDAGGRLRAWPRRPSVRRAALRHLARRFDREAAPSGREVNAALATGLSRGDPATVRREMVVAGLLLRDPAGRSYRRAPPDALPDALPDAPPDAPPDPLPGEVTT